MNRKIIKIIILAVIIVLLAGGGYGLYRFLTRKPVTGQIEFGTPYYLKEIHPDAFDNVTINADSFLQINADQKTGTLHLVGLPNPDLQFIVTDYHEGSGKTTFSLEYIDPRTYTIRQLNATSTNAGIYFTAEQAYQVDVTQEHPDDTHVLFYESTILVFAKEVA